MNRLLESSHDNPVLARFKESEISEYVRKLHSMETTLLSGLETVFKKNGWQELDISDLEKRLGGDKLHNFSSEVFDLLTELANALRKLDLSQDEVVAFVGLLFDYRKKMDTEGLAVKDWKWLYRKASVLVKKNY
ncbi:MAG: hypothetical protein WAU07_05465 [Microgenomates group bacterium]